MVEQAYIHGFDEIEQNRLLQQGEILAPLVHSGVDFSNCSSVLEIGSGVGAQTLQLLKKFPHLKITCVEHSETQLDAARINVKEAISSGQVRLLKASAEDLPFEVNSFDGIFVCWLLEHVQSPLRVLQEANRVLQPKGRIFLREVFNRVFYMSPHSAIDLLWEEFNQKQIQMGGDPFVGVQLGNLLNKTSFQEIDLFIESKVLDQRSPQELSTLLDYWRKLFLSGFQDDQEKSSLINREFAKFHSDSRSVFCFGFAKASAIK